MGATLLGLKENEKAKIRGLDGGMEFQRKLASLNIREGKTVKMITKQPFGGPIVIEVDRRKITIGRGMARRIFVEVKK